MGFDYAYLLLIPRPSLLLDYARQLTLLLFFFFERHTTCKLIKAVDKIVHSAKGQ